MNPFKVIVSVTSLWYKKAESDSDQQDVLAVAEVCMPSAGEYIDTSSFMSYPDTNQGRHFHCWQQLPPASHQSALEKEVTLVTCLVQTQRRNTRTSVAVWAKFDPFQHSEKRLELMFILVRPRCFRGVERAKAAFMGMSHSRSDSSSHSSNS